MKTPDGDKAHKCDKVYYLFMFFVNVALYATAWGYLNGVILQKTRHDGSKALLRFPQEYTAIYITSFILFTYIPQAIFVFGLSFSSTKDADDNGFSNKDVYLGKYRSQVSIYFTFVIALTGIITILIVGVYSGDNGNIWSLHWHRNFVLAVGVCLLVALFTFTWMNKERYAWAPRVKGEKYDAQVDEQEESERLGDAPPSYSSNVEPTAYSTLGMTTLLFGRRFGAVRGFLPLMDFPYSFLVMYSLFFFLTQMFILRDQTELLMPTCLGIFLPVLMAAYCGHPSYYLPFHFDALFYMYTFSYLLVCFQPEDPNWNLLTVAPDPVAYPLWIDTRNVYTWVTFIAGVLSIPFIAWSLESGRRT